ncbi:MAG: sugar phosphate isomerase/epimerase [Clostridia bacterium]|nr:sugar phosphate isomerase/epimerase [Clostridia bacterium]
MIRLSAFSDEAGKELSVQISALVRNNISLTELRSVGDKNVSELTVSEAKDISARLEDSGIGLSALGSPMGKVDISIDFDGYLDSVKHMCELARVLGTERIRMFSFYNAYGERARVLEYLCRMAEVAGEYGIHLCHENEKKIYGDTAERVLDLAANVSGLRFVYDPANFLQVGELPSRTLPTLHGISDYFHIKDVVFRTGELVPAGEGDGNISELVRMIDRDTVLTLEPHLKIFGGYEKFDGEKMHHRHHFRTNGEAFDAAVSALKKILTDNGYTEKNGGYVKK